MDEFGLVTFTTFALGVVVGGSVHAYKDYRSSSRTAGAKQRLYWLALTSLSMMVVTGSLISAFMRFVNSHCA